MAANTFILSFVAILTCFYLPLYEAVKIEITPPATTGPSTATVNCTSETSDNATRIVLMKLANGNGATIAVLLAKGNSKLLAPFDKRNDLQYSSSLFNGNETDKSYLQLTMTKPTPDLSASYTCTVYYTDTHGAFRHGTDSDYLNIKDSRIDQMAREVIALESKLSQQRIQLDALKSGLSSQIAFSASKTRVGPKLKTGVDVVFDYLPLNEGNAFNKTDGTLTAPNDGLYVFHLSTKTFLSGCKLNVELRLHGVSVMTGVSIGELLPTGGSIKYDEDSSSTITSLSKGDQVKPYIVSTDCPKTLGTELTLAGYFIGSP